MLRRSCFKTRKIKDYTNQIIVNDYGLEVYILDLYDKRKRASYWRYICPYCGNDNAVNDISKIKSIKSCDKCKSKPKQAFKDIEKSNNKKQDYSENFYNRFSNDKIELLTSYINAKTKILCRCKVDGYEWSTVPSVLLRGSGCPKCSNNLQKTTDSFIEEVNNLWGEEYKVVGEYINSKTKIKIKHNKCNNIFEMAPTNILNGQECPCCKNRRQSERQLISISTFRDKILNLVKNEYDVLSTEYKGANTKILFKHNTCNHIFKMSPSKFINGKQRCPLCNQSKGEKMCQQYFDDNNIKYVVQKSFYNLVGLGGKSLSYDFYLPEYNLLIEYQGEFHDGKANTYVAENLKKQQEHDRRKGQYAKDHNIKLLEIWYWDFNNIAKILSSELGFVT